MTVIFGQTATLAAATVADAARTAPVTERLLDMGSDDAWIAQLSADIAATRSQDGDLSFRLMTRPLGRLDVAMTRGDDGVAVRLANPHEQTATRWGERHVGKQCVGKCRSQWSQYNL